MYRRKYNQTESNALYDKNSIEVNLVQSGDMAMIEKYSCIFDEQLYSDCVIIPMVSEYASKETYDNIFKLVSEICLKDNKRINGTLLINKNRYLDHIKDYFKEEISKNILVNYAKIGIIKRKKVIIFTDVINSNLNGYLSYKMIIKKYSPKSIELIALARYVES